MVYYSCLCSLIAGPILSLLFPKIGLAIYYSIPLTDTNPDILWTRYQEWIHLANLSFFTSMIILVFLRSIAVKYQFLRLLFKCTFVYSPILTTFWMFISFVFGAPLWTAEDWIKASSFSLYLSQLTIWIMLWHQRRPSLLPWIYSVLDIDESNSIIDTTPVQSSGRLLYISTIIFGLWCGSIVVPLDWGKPWQFWPIPHLISIQLALCIVSPVILILSLLVPVTHPSLSPKEMQ